MYNSTDAFHQMIARGSPARSTQPQFGLPQEGRVLQVNDDGTVDLVIDNFSSDIKIFGAKTAAVTPSPQPGDECLVTFANGELSRAWVLAWSTPN